MENIPQNINQKLAIDVKEKYGLPNIISNVKIYCTSFTSGNTGLINYILTAMHLLHKPDY